MTVHIDISNRQKMTHFLELLKSMDFVERVRVEDSAPVPTESTPVQPLFFDQFYGCMPNLDVTAFEDYLAEIRGEWDERDLAHDRIRTNPADNPYRQLPPDYLSWKQRIS